MKKIIIMLSMVFFAVSVFAEIAAAHFKPTVSTEEFDITVWVDEGIEILDIKNQDDAHVNYALGIGQGALRGECRFTLYADTGTTSESVRQDFFAWIVMCMQNVTGIDIRELRGGEFQDADVKNEFGGDFGMRVLTTNPKSQFAKGYKYIMVEFFCKQGQGIVMRTWLANDSAFFGGIFEGNFTNTNAPIFQNYHNFRFAN